MTIFPYNIKKQLRCAIILFHILICTQLVFAMDPKFEIDSKDLSSSVKKLSSHRERNLLNAKKNSVIPDKAVIHTVRYKDNIFKILMRDYGFSNDEAEACIEEIRRENNIYDIKRLRIGQKIIIPMLKRTADGTVKKVPNQVGGGTTKFAQSLRLEAPVNRLSDQEASIMLRQAWESIVPQKQNAEKKPITLSSEAFSLKLDPERYPVYAGYDGSKIIVDSSGSIPPLVKSLITEKDPSIRIVTESPSNNRNFLHSLLGAAGFYSLEENFSMEFGKDPKLTVNTDFKIEKTKESLINQDITLVNAGRNTMPAAIVALLKKEGFTIHEPFATVKSFNMDKTLKIHQITALTQSEIVDAILSAISLSSINDKQVDVFASDNNGISLAVKAERYFEKGNKKYVITRFDGDPVNYTLFRILETKGYQVVILEQKDNFKQVAEKMLSRMSIHNNYRPHALIKNSGSNYQVEMSGIMLDDSGKQLFITNLAIDKTIQDILTENGYTISKR